MSFARYKLFGLLLLAGPLAWGVSGDPPGGVRCSGLVVRNDRFQALALTEMLGMERYVRDNHFARFVEELGLSQRVSEAVRAAVDVVDPLALNRETVARMATSLGLVTEAEKGGLYATLARRLGVDTRHTLAILRKMETELLGSDTGARARANESLLVELEKVAAELARSVQTLQRVAAQLSVGSAPAVPLSAREVTSLILELVARGLRSAQVSDLMADLTAAPPTPPSGDLDLSSYLRNFLRDRSLALARVTLRSPGEFPRPPPEGFFHAASREPVDFAQEIALRVAQGGHAIDAEAYIERHFGRGLMEALADDPGMRIRIFQGSFPQALAELGARGFTEVIHLPHNEFTDFVKLLARNPRSGEVTLALFARSGRAYAREIAAHFTLWGRGRVGARVFDPARIEIYHTRSSAADEFVAILQKEHIDPDILVLENGTEFNRLLAAGLVGQERSVTQSVHYSALSARVTRVDGKTVMSVAIEPSAYADRAGALVEALSRLSNKHRSIVFFGTAGALDRTMRIGDLVSPQSFSDANGLIANPVIGFTNEGPALLRRLGVDSQAGVYAGSEIRHGAVDSILFEDRVWIAAHRGSPEPLSIVEQELASLASAARGGKSRVYVFLRISDIVGSVHHDFSRQELNRPAPRPRVTPRELLIYAVNEALAAGTTP